MQSLNHFVIFFDIFNWKSNASLQWNCVWFSCDQRYIIIKSKIHRVKVENTALKNKSLWDYNWQYRHKQGQKSPTVFC